MYRISGMDLDHPENRLQVMKQLKPFEMLAEQVHIEDDLLSSLWDALRKAEKGDAVELKEILRQCIETTTRSMDSKSEAPVLDDESLLASPNQEQENSSEE